TCRTIEEWHLGHCLSRECTLDCRHRLIERNSRCLENRNLRGNIAHPKDLIDDDFLRCVNADALNAVSFKTSTLEFEGVFARFDSCKSVKPYVVRQRVTRDIRCLAC